MNILVVNSLFFYYFILFPSQSSGTCNVLIVNQTRFALSRWIDFDTPTWRDLFEQSEQVYVKSWFDAKMGRDFRRGKAEGKGRSAISYATESLA